MRLPSALLYGLITVALDLGTKSWALQTLRLRDIEVIPYFFRLSLVHNYGIAFGFFSYQSSSRLKSILLISVAVLALISVAAYAFKPSSHRRLQQLALGLLMGGILGNLADRALHSYVVDFLEFNLYFFKFPTFNIADSGITVGVGLLLLETFLEKQNPEEERGTDAEPS
ncbi:MAG TPA: signal peptidase II [Acidobacteriota bacterium]|jgi:signal peptidase II